LLQLPIATRPTPSSKFPGGPDIDDFTDGSDVRATESRSRATKRRPHANENQCNSSDWLLGERGIVSENSYVGIYMAVSVACALFLVWDICRMRGAAFKETGYRKSVWLLIWLVSSGALLSPFVLIWYLVRVRPKVRQADMDHIASRHRRKMARRQAAYARRRAAPAPSRTSFSSSSPTFERKPQSCGRCGGSGTLPCGPCQGRGRRTSSTPSANDPYFHEDWCTSCGGTGKLRCTPCHGTGKV
jgi:hypothetical protein